MPDDYLRSMKPAVVPEARGDDRATNAHFRLDKPSGAIGKPLIVLYPSLSLNQRVPGSSPGAPTTLFNSLTLISTKTVSSV
jgi:hypothetical protein